MSRTSIRSIATTMTLAAALATAGGCANAGEGLLSGAGVGALAGLIVGSSVGSPGQGAAIGAAIGGASGAVIGDQNERNERYNAQQRASMYQTAPAYNDYGYTTTERRTVYRTYEYYGPSVEYRRSYRYPYRCR